jgi:hypothetical protein
MWPVGVVIVMGWVLGRQLITGILTVQKWAVAPESAMANVVVGDGTGEGGVG